MPDIFHHPIVVAADEIDVLGHASNLAYLRWMQDAALAHSAAQGWPTERYHKNGHGWVVRAHEIKYHRPALLGDAVVIHTWVATLKKFSSLRRYDIVRAADETMLATASTEWAFIDFATRTLKRIPPEVVESLDVVANPAPSP